LFDGRNDSEDQVDEAIAVRLVQGYAITGNLFHTIGFIGAQTGPSIGAITGNSAVDSSCLGVGVNGGSKSAPQHTVVTNNSFMRNFCGGIIVLGDSVMLEGYDIGAQAGLFTLDALPNETLTSVATEIIGNRLSNNDVPGGDGFGVRIGIYSGSFGMNPAQTFTQVNVLMKSNEVRDNLVGILVNSAFLSRDFAQTFSARVNATFIDNDVCGNETAPAIFDFTGVGADPASVKYLQNSTYWLTYSGHDLDGFGYNNPASDPYLLPAVTPLNNTLRVNGVSLHGTSAPTPRPCANDSARH